MACNGYISISASFNPLKSGSSVSTFAFRLFAVCYANASARLKFGLVFLIAECSKPVSFASCLPASIIFDNEAIDAQASSEPSPSLSNFDMISAIVAEFVAVSSLSIILLA
ncbi:MAG: hypothetical protein ACREBH_01475 [Candidatus Micrarchaeaceae archaeon]